MEIVNEHQGFKYWKQNKKVNFSKLKEEVVDALHFILSIGLDLEIKIEHYFQIIKFKSKKMNVNRAFLLLIRRIMNFWMRRNEKNFFWILNQYFTLINLLQITKSELINEYHRKNEINKLRQQNNY
jgi:dimeric dUTPase (all-alpha-NTP-PPase superfamily)